MTRAEAPVPSNSVTVKSSLRAPFFLVSNQDRYHNYTDNLSCLTMKIAVNYKPSKVEYVPQMDSYCAVVSLNHLLLVPEMSKKFLESGGKYFLSEMLNNTPGMSLKGGKALSSDLQTMYQTFLTCWILSHEECSQAMFEEPSCNIIRGMVSVLNSISREKFSRVGMKVFKNLSTYPACVELMIDNNLQKVVENEQRKNIKDEVLRENLSYLNDVLEKNYRILSVWEKYSKELKTNNLAWGPCHTEKFWKSNVKKLEDENFANVDKLVTLLKSPDETTRAVACYDLGEFCRFYPRARLTLDKNGGKEELMKLMSSEVPAVREQALWPPKK